MLRLAAPLVVSFWMRQLFTFVDTLYASMLDERIAEPAMAAIGLTIPFEFLMIAMWVGISTGLTSTFSRAMGARESKKLEAYLAASSVLSFALVPVFAAIGIAIWFFAGALSPNDPVVARQLQIYGSVLIGGSAFTMFWSIIPDSVVKAHQDTKATMWAGIWSNVINVGLNTIFTFVFHWGIFGIGLSTVIGRFGGLVYALRKAGAHEARRKAAWTNDVATLDPHPYRSILRLAAPATAAYGLMAGEAALINAVLKALPNATSALAAYSVYYRVLMFMIMPAVATSVAMLPFTARLWGERDIRGMRRGLTEATVALVAYCLLFVAPVVAFGAPLLAKLLAKSPDTVGFIVVSLWLCPIACLTALPFFLCRPMFEGLQMPKPGFVVAILRYVVLTGPLAWLGAHVATAMGYAGLYGLISGLIAATAISSGVIYGWMLSTLRRIDRTVDLVPSPA
ncbi:MAG: MATE family efflux transporter [Acidobacteriota bacterium]